MRKRVICDENLPHKLRTLIPEHDLFSVAYMQWVGIKNGELLDVAERAHFDVLITSDQGIPHQQNMAGRTSGGQTKSTLSNEPVRQCTSIIGVLFVRPRSLPVAP